MNEYQVYLRLKVLIAGLHNFTDAQYGKGDLKKLSNDLLMALLKKHDACGLEFVENQHSIPPRIDGALLDTIYFPNGKVFTDMYGVKCEYTDPISCLALYKAIH